MPVDRYIRIGLLLAFILGGVTADPDKLTTITVEAAEKLVGKHKRYLKLNGLLSLTPEVAAVLAKHESALDLNGLKTLTAEVATALANHGSGDTNPRSTGLLLRLNGLTRLSPEVAEVLSRHEGRLHLRGLQELNSVSLARKLAAQKLELYLDGLLTLSPEIAAILVTNEGTLEDRTRPGVVQRRKDLAASVLRFTDLVSLSIESAKVLSKHRGVLVLNGMESIPANVAAELARRDGGTLVLNGLLTLSPETAEALASYNGEIALKALRELSPEAASALSRHKHKIYLTGPTTLSVEALSTIRQHPNVRLSNRYMNRHTE